MILAIDTSSAVAVAVVDGDRVLARRTAFAPRSHAELLAGFVRDALAESDADPGRIEGVVVGTGPAPFTGLRVGLVTARVLARAWNVPVWGVCSLDAIGAEHAAARGGQATVLADARRREVYWATYRDAERIAGPGVATPLDVARIGTVLGRGAAMYAEVLGVPVPTLLDPDPAWLARIALARLDAGESVDHLPVEPLYLRRPDVHGIPGV